MSSTTTTAGFADLGVADDLCSRLTQGSRTEPFPIQAAAIPAALDGNDVCGRAHSRGKRKCQAHLATRFVAE